MKRISLLLALLLITGVISSYGQFTRAKDSTIIFTPSRPDLVDRSEYNPLRNAWGVDIMLSNNGFAGGFFFRKELTDDLAASVTFAISDVKDDAEVEYYDQWTGQSSVPGKVNRLLLMPLIFSLQHRLFRDDIVDNFRPYVTAGVGPSMVFVAPYIREHRITPTYSEYEQVEFFSSLKFGQAKYTVGMFVGAGAYFGLDRGTLSGLSIRYYYVPFKKGIEVLQGGYVRTFGGFYITLNFGSLY
jgi:outer membrane protein W